MCVTFSTTRATILNRRNLRVVNSALVSGLVDVDGEEAARVVVGMKERELLVAVHGIAGIVDIQRDGGRWGREAAAEEIDQGGPSCAPPRC